MALNKFAITLKSWIQTKNTLFIWIPKTAGTSIFRHFESAVRMKRILEYEDAKKSFNNRGSVTFGHLSIDQLLKDGVIDNNYYNNCIKFTVVRNPYDRFISLYFYLKQERKIPSWYSISDFRSRIIDGIEPVGLYNVDGMSQANPQTKWLINIDVDVQIRFENLRADFAAFAREMNLKNLTLPHLNRSISRKYSEIKLDTRTIEFINTYYKVDFQKLKYPFIE